MPERDTYKLFVSDLSKTVDRKRIYTDPLRCFGWGTDAGFYRMTPQVVVRAANTKEVSEALKIATRYNLPVTFRAAGTSLSGQSISDSILIVAGKHWEKYEIGDEGNLITLQPGIIGQRVNELLAPYGKQFGPDPASKKSAMVGGIVMNNASGMNCGVHANSDRCLVSIELVLADGTILDTADENSRQAFMLSHGHVIEEICAIRDAIRRNDELVRLIHYKYAIKNVTGLNLLPFVTYEDPFEIIAHCMVGSEGTLGFMSRVTMKTVHLYPFTASAMLYFSDMAEACRAVVAMRKDAPIQSCELLDKKSLSTVHDNTGEGLTALLLETKADTREQLDENIAKVLEVLRPFDMFQQPHFTTDPDEYVAWWAIRSGIFPAVGGTRRPGTTALIEDIAFHIEDLPEATVALADILARSGYDDACIYGHALEGNYHFIISQAFDSPQEIERYRSLMSEIEHLVTERFHGSLKAEHGTGRNMAPFVRHEWGDDAWQMMRRLKQALDPKGLLNPGVIFNPDPECYIKHLKSLPLFYEPADRCIECGFCEVNCVSCGLTLSARQRIAVQREITRLKHTGQEPGRLNLLEKSFRYYGDETCAGDGLCSTSCPMKINTGDLVHAIRQKSLPEGSTGYKIGNWAANHLPSIKGTLRPMLSTANGVRSVIGDKAVNVLGRGLHKLGLPLWNSSLPGAYHRHDMAQQPQASKVVYFPSCINQTMGSTAEGKTKPRPLIDVMVELCNKAGYEVIFPANMNALCCGMIWSSKGMPDIAQRKSDELEKALRTASCDGKYPILCDQSPCLHHMREHMKSLKLFEPAEFIEKFLVPNLIFRPTDTPVAIHVTCSTRRMGLADTIISLARRCSSDVMIPTEVGCCGFTGDKGFTYPELNAWGLRKLRVQIQAAGIKYGYSNSRTCEIGLSANSGIPYKSIAYLVNEVTRPRGYDPAYDEKPAEQDNAELNFGHTEDLYHTDTERLSEFMPKEQIRDNSTYLTDRESTGTENCSVTDAVDDSTQIIYGDTDSDETKIIYDKN